MAPTAAKTILLATEFRLRKMAPHDRVYRTIDLQSWIFHRADDPMSSPRSAAGTGTSGLESTEFCGVEVRTLQLPTLG